MAGRQRVAVAEERTTPAVQVKSSAWVYLGFGILILLIAMLVRFHNLGAQSLWNDEGSSYVQASRNFADIATNAARDIHPPGYYWLLAFWQRSTGDSEFALRALSALASILTIAFTYALGKRLFNPVAGLAAALFVALNTFSIYYAQEARMYALLGLWSVMGMWALAGLLIASNELTKKRYAYVARNSPDYQAVTHYGIWLAFINAAGLYTQYAYPFVMIAQGVILLIWLVMHHRHTRLTALIHVPALSIYLQSILATALLFLPWMPTALHQITSWPSTGQPIPAAEALSTIAGWFTFGLTYPQIPGANWLVPVFLLISIIGMVAWVATHSRRWSWHVLLPLLWVAIPVLLFLLLGLFRPANLKFLLPAEIGFGLWLGGSVGGWWMVAPLVRRYWNTRLYALLIIIALVAFLYSGLPALYDDSAYQRSDYRAIVAAISADPRPGDAIILDAPNQQEVFSYYYRGSAPIFPLPAGLGGDDAQTLASVHDIMAHYQRIFVLFWGDNERDPNHIVENTLDTETFQAGEDVWYGDVRFAVYMPPASMPAPTDLNAHFGDHITLVSAALNTETLHPGDVLQTALNWQTDALLNDAPAYKIFLQLLNSDGVLVAQRDTEPVSGSRPTTGWKPGETILDRQGLTIPADLPPGDYQLIVGMYDSNNPSARLPVTGKDYLSLGTIHIQPS